VTTTYERAPVSDPERWEPCTSKEMRRAVGPVEADLLCEGEYAVVRDREDEWRFRKAVK
jgi:hypothetical protein